MLLFFHHQSETITDRRYVYHDDLDLRSLLAISYNDGISKCPEITINLKISDYELFKWIALSVLRLRG